MELITSAVELQQSFSECLSRCSRAYIAVAWMRDGFAMQQLKSSKCSFHAVIGTDFGMTDSAMVEELWKSAGQTDVVRLFPESGRTFHPKFYLFESNGTSEVLVGSANMTAAAFTENYEAMVHFRLATAHSRLWIAAWRRWWEACPVLSPKDLARYSQREARWSKVSVAVIAERSDLKRRSVRSSSKRLRNRGHLIPKLSEVVAIPFSEYISLLRKRLKRIGWSSDSLDAAELGYSNYLSVIERGHVILHEDGFPSPTDFDRFGMVLGTRKDSAWLGNMKSIRSGWKVLRRTGFIKRLRSRMRPLLVAVTESDIIKYGRAMFVEVASQHGLSHGVATRLLALARPDRFFSLNRSSEANLADLFGVPASELRNWEGYEGAIRVLWAATWFQSAEPTDSDMSRLWRARVALIDALVYTHQT